MSVDPNTGLPLTGLLSLSIGDLDLSLDSEHVKQQLRQFEEQSLDIFFIESYLRTCCLLLVSTVRCNTLGSTWQKPIRFAKTTNKSGCSPLHSAALDPVYLSLAPSWNVMTYNTQLLLRGNQPCRPGHDIQAQLLWESTNHVIQVMIHKHTTLIRKNQPCHPGCASLCSPFPPLLLSEHSLLPQRLLQTWWIIEMADRETRQCVVDNKLQCQNH